MHAASLNSYPVSKRGVHVLLYYLIFSIGLLPACIFALKRPYYNWDMLPYMAIALRIDNPQIHTVHNMTYKSAKENIPAREYGFLISSDYRKRMAESPASFHRQLPFYIVKPLYIGLVYLFYKSGISLPVSTVLPSVVAYFLIGLLLLHWLAKYLKPFFAIAGGLLIMYSTYMMSAARISSPDCLSAFFLLAAIYFIIQTPSLKFMFLFFILAILTRIDNIVTAFTIISFLAFGRTWEKEILIKHYFLMISVMIACYFGITFLATPFNWNVFYYPTFATSLDLSKKIHSTFPLREYFSLMYSKAITAVVFSHITTFIFIVLLIFVPWRGHVRKFTFDQLFALLLVSTIIVRFILFPDLSDRFYTAFYLTILMLLVRKISQNEYTLNKPHA